MIKHKVICRGEIRPDQRKSNWTTWADEVTERPNGDLAIIPWGQKSGMGFRAGGWGYRRKVGDYDIYDVDFSARFPARRSKASHAGR